VAYWTPIQVEQEQALMDTEDSKPLTHCHNACHKKWGFTDNGLCDCGEIPTVSHIVNSCPLTKFDGSLLRLHEADEAAVDWLTTLTLSTR